MNRQEAIKLVKRAIKSKYGTQLAASEGIGLEPVQISRVMTGYTKAISPQLLELAGLEAVVPPTTYRKKQPAGCMK